LLRGVIPPEKGYKGLPDVCQVSDLPEQLESDRACLLSGASRALQWEKRQMSVFMVVLAREKKLGQVGHLIPREMYRRSFINEKTTLFLFALPKFQLNKSLCSNGDFYKARYSLFVLYSSREHVEILEYHLSQ
jgi:hypothetical protein